MALLHIEILEHEHFTYEGHRGKKENTLMKWQKFS